VAAAALLSGCASGPKNIVKAGRRLCLALLALLVACIILFMSSCGGYVSETAPEGTATPTDEPISLDEIYRTLFSQLASLPEDTYRSPGDPVLTDIRYGSSASAPSRRTGPAKRHWHLCMGPGFC